MDGEARNVARQCRHYAMCKIDYLGTGLCPGAATGCYTSFYPQGRMDIYTELAAGELHVTPALVKIAESCTLCGRCDRQCYFVTELRPSKAARALKKYVEGYLKSGAAVTEVEPGPLLPELRAIVGDDWATCDPAHRAAYASDPSPVSTKTYPDYVVLPGTAEEVREIVRLCRRERVEYAVRGNGSSVMGFVLSNGLVMDMTRMDRMEFDLNNWAVRIGAGVSSYRLQKAALERGCLVNAAEPAALYCANLMCSGIFSLFSSSVGTAADNVIDAHFVSNYGETFRLSQRDSPNLFAFRKAQLPQPGICTEATVRLHPLTGDESGIAVPFASMSEALEYSRELNVRGIGLGIGVVGVEYLSSFLAPVSRLAGKLRSILPDRLGIEYLVIVLGDAVSLESARRMAPSVLENDLIRCITLGMTELDGDGIATVLETLDGEEPPFAILGKPGMLPILEAALDPSPAKLASAMDPELAGFFEKVYGRSEITDIFSMNAIRILSSRMGREGHVVAFIVYVPLDDIPGIQRLDESFREITVAENVRGDFGFLTPVDRGRMGILEWDMYLDHTDQLQVQLMRRAMARAGEMLDGLSDPRTLWIKYVFNQGFSRKESFLYHGANGG